jgi:hypothetical protein
MEKVGVNLTVSFVAGMVVGMVVFWRALGDKGLE